ncbi:rod shape-determining protein [candidate division NPL-UPA2 bacterium Unc8]|uniref:Cell shape-determining protein MreB n=1 Tax=candidate division NPL-UPA2 bacterium Unc8 TaxID=1980939 RepID=A0A399FXS0_UNCN2|nr:Rod shape-determining protein MreB [Bacillota bacterium]RII00256.1 MAG: rod shape-determining protein [candidate division NPL-UPA2 bacterium Unc8]
MALNFFSRLFSNDIGIDLGTANTLVYLRGRGIVLNEPSVIAVEKRSDRDRILITADGLPAVGNEARRMIGRTPGNIVAIRPLKDGVIADFIITEEMLRYFMRRVYRRRMFIAPRVIIAVPAEITEVEARAVEDSVRQAGASEVYPIEQPMAAAIGADLPVEEPGANLVLDIGGGTTAVAVISFGGIVISKTVKIAGDEMDEAIIQHLKRAYNLMIGERTAEDVKIKIGSAFPLDEEMTMEVRGRDLVAGLPKTLTITSQEVREILADGVNTIIETVKTVLEETPPELSADLVDKGMTMSGGGALLKGLDQRIREETGLEVNVVENPLQTVVIGTGKLLDNIRLLRRIASSD